MTWAEEEFAGAELGDMRFNRWLTKLTERIADKPKARIPGVSAGWSETQAVYRFLDQANNAKRALDWLIRSKHNRTVPGGSKLWVQTLEGEALGEIEFALAARPGQTARVVRQQLWARPMDIQDGVGGLLSVTCVVAKEMNPPADCKAVERRLLTHRTVTDFAAAIELIECYRCRWEIEIFFNLLKNGCRVEALQLGSVAKLELALVVNMVVAWRLARLVRLGRTHPDLAASASLLTQAEWQGAYILAKKTPPTQPPTLRQVIRQIAMLGGFLGRKSDGEPGVKTLWLGFARLRDFVEGVEHMRNLQHSGPRCV